MELRRRVLWVCERTMHGQSQASSAPVSSAASWANVFARAGWNVRVWDPDAGSAPRRARLIEQSLHELARHGLVQDPTPRPSASRSSPRSRRPCAGADYVQEMRARGARGEARDLRAARRAPRRADTILASSTSAIVASTLHRGARRPRALHRRAPGESAAPRAGGRAVRRAVDLAGDQAPRASRSCESVGQVPIDVKREIDGFILNRLQVALLTEAFRLVQEGYVSPEDLDHTIADGLGLRWAFMGPFETIELNAPGGIARLLPSATCRGSAATWPTCRAATRLGRCRTGSAPPTRGEQATHAGADRRKSAWRKPSASRRWSRTSARREPHRIRLNRARSNRNGQHLPTPQVVPQGHHHLRGHRRDPHADDVAAPADHRRRDRRRPRSAPTRRARRSCTCTRATRRTAAPTSGPRRSSRS